MGKIKLYHKVVSIFTKFSSHYMTIFISYFLSISITIFIPILISIFIPTSISDFFRRNQSLSTHIHFLNPHLYIIAFINPIYLESYKHLQLVRRLKIHPPQWVSHHHYLWLWRWHQASEDFDASTIKLTTACQIPTRQQQREEDGTYCGLWSFGHQSYRSA